jgi:hypothetical protein
MGDGRKAPQRHGTQTVGRGPETRTEGVGLSELVMDGSLIGGFPITNSQIASKYHQTALSWKPKFAFAGSCHSQTTALWN